MHRITVSLLALTALSLPFTAQAESLDTMLRTVVNQHPRIAAAKHDVQAANASKEEAFSGYLPTVDVNGSIGYEDIDRRELIPAGSQTEEDTTTYSAAITQNVFRGFSTQTAVETADINTAIAQYELANTHQQIVLEGINAYIEVLRFVELSNLALENQSNLRSQLNLEDERVKRGSGIAVDALQAKSRLQISAERHTAFMGGLQDAISRYAQIFNRAPDLSNMARPPLPLEHVPDSLKQAVQIAIANNPQLASSKKNVLRAEKNQISAKSGYYPSVDIVAATSHDENVSGIVGEEERQSVRLQTSWQIFSGFADRSRVKQATYGYHSAKETAQYAQRKVVEEVKFAWSSMTTNQRRMQLLDNAVNIAGEVYDARTRLRDAGSETALNVLDAENELYRARIDAASARYDYYLSVYRLLMAMGQLSVDTATPRS
ncbi:MAG: TolC family outer membrane protein [Alphaproteobacteria bacterium]|nr:TolC family outer membrane protein [Alphaproteobacteria bacterium]